MTKGQMAAILAPVLCLAPMAAHADDEAWQRALKEGLYKIFGVREVNAKSAFKAALSSNEVRVQSTVLRVRIDGIRVEPEQGGRYTQNTVQDGVVVKSGRGLRGIMGGADNVARRSLKIGERIMIWKIEIDDDLVRFYVITVDPEQVLIRGTTVMTRYWGAVLLPFGESAMPKVTPDQVAATLSPVLGTEDAVASAQTKTVALGQTNDEVKEVLGPPDKVLDLKTKVTWVYKDIKVIFVNGRVADIQ